MVLDTIIASIVAYVVFAARDVLSDQLRSSFGWFQGSEVTSERLNRSLNRFQSVVSRAEKTSRGSEFLQLWQLEIRDLMYDIDDILDEISYESLKKKKKKKKVEGEDGAFRIGRKRKLSEMIGLLEADFGWNFNSTQLIARMSERAASLDKWTDRVLSHISLETTGGEPNLRNLVPTSSCFSGEMIIGRDEDKHKLIRFLQSDTSYTSDISLIALVGMPGIGKTTLAQLVIIDDDVRFSFDLIAWIHVSHNFDIVRLTKSLIESIEGQACNLVELEALQKKLRKLVREGRRSLLVLDDVWNENLHLWQAFASPLRMKGIKIIVTTQNESVAAVMQTVPPLKLKMLPEDECVELLKNHAFGDGRHISVIQGDNDISERAPLVGLENDFPDLLKAAKKCGGLPLAVKELGHRIRSVSRYQTQDLTWRDILREDFNPANEFTTGMLSSLKLSYDLLPANLRHCIGYCALFPEDYVYEKDHLARLWAAQGFVQFENDVARLTREDVCRGYFDELVRRSFFLPLDSTTDSGGFKMHGLIHSLCKFVSLGEANSYGKGELFQGCPQFHGELRHMFVASEKPVVVPDHVPLRTYIYNHVQLDHQRELNIPKGMLLNLKYVRSLVINCSAIRILPNSFGNLKYLKYLRLSCFRICELPKSIGNLYNLQMLDLCGCTELRELPPSIGNLIELWFLGLPRVELRKRTCLIPPEIGSLTSLRTLAGIVLSQELDDRGSVGIRELKRLVNLQELHITGLANLTNVRDAIEVDMKSKQFLEILRLQWREPAESSRLFACNDYRVLENLEPHKNLRELVIIGYGGDHFPSWLSDSSLSNLTKMTLIGCEGNYCFFLPALDQLRSLKCLSIGWMPELYHFRLNFNLPSTSVAFPCLVELSFEEMQNWEYWLDDVGHPSFPVLRKLTVKSCKNLRELPHFPSLTELYITGCDRLDDFLLRSTQYNQILRRVRREKTQVDKIVELPPTSSAADSSLPHDERDKQKSTVKGLPSDDYHANSDKSLPHNEVDCSPICGRENDTNRILEILLSDKSGEHNVTFMCVVAPSGVGKTTIIHHIFNNYTISEAFDTRIWVCISGVLDEKTLMREIIESITQLSCVWTDLDLLHEIVQEELNGKRFLLILDGAQNENKSFWSSALTVLDVGARGSIVVLATKSQVVADASDSEHCHYLDYLSGDNCWSLFGSLYPKFPKYLMERCRYLVEKCEGIPLCVKMIGGCFHNAKTEERVAALSKIKFWETDNCGGRILPALRVCYEFLPLELRKCFAYCALFPKNHVFVKDHIVSMWMSQVLIDPIGGENFEDIGSRYFDELVSRSFLHISPIHDGRDGKFLMHDLVHDLAECMSSSHFFRSEDCSESVPSYVSHLALAPSEFKKVELSMLTEQVVQLETFLVVNRFTPQLYNIGLPVVSLLGLNDLFEKYRNIQTLDLSDTDIKELPESIGLLISLGFLRINNTGIKNISPQICELSKLKTLEARNCCYLVDLPTDLNKLTSLRHLDIRKESGFVAIPSGISDLKNLRTLPVFNVGNDEFHSSIGELQELKHLKGELQITGIENIRNKHEAKVAKLESKNSLECLILEWCGSGSGIETEASPEEVLGYLQPPSYLQEMVIRNYTGTKFPIWIEKRYLPKLVSVTLDNCFKCVKFPYLGNLPSLKYLCAQKMHLVETLTDTPNAAKSNNHPNFQFLEVLKLSEMYSLEDLFQLEDGDFPRLRSLFINSCPMLRKIPRFASLVELSLSRCPELPDISELSSVQFLKIDRVENLEHLELRDKLPMLKKLEISNCRELSEVHLSDGASSVKTKFVRCPKLDGCNPQKNASNQGESQLAKEDPKRSFEQQSEELDDDYLYNDYYSLI